MEENCPFPATSSIDTQRCLKTPQRPLGRVSMGLIEQMNEICRILPCFQQSALSASAVRGRCIGRLYWNREKNVDPKHAKRAKICVWQIGII